MFEDNRTSPLDTLPSLIAALCWGAMFPIAASAMHHIDPFPLTAIRYGVAVPVWVVLLLALEGRRALRTDGRTLDLFVLGSLGSPASTCSPTSASSTRARRTPR